MGKSALSFPNKDEIIVEKLNSTVDDLQIFHIYAGKFSKSR